MSQGQRQAIAAVLQSLPLRQSLAVLQSRQLTCAAMNQSTALCRYGCPRCDTCDRSSDQCQWASYRLVRDGDGEVSSKVAAGTDCLDCVSTGMERYPGEQWAVIKKRVNATSASKEEHIRRCKIRRKEEQPDFLPASVWQTKKVTGKWITTLVPKRLTDIREPEWRKIQSSGKVSVEHYEDALGDQHPCILLKDDRFPDRLELTVEKTTEIFEFCFDGQRQLDPTQSTEIYDKLRKQMLQERPERLFSVAMTWEQLQEALQKPQHPNTAAGSGDNVGPPEASVHNGNGEEVVSMVTTCPLGQRLAVPMETDTYDVPGPSPMEKKRKREPKDGKEPRAPKESKGAAASRSGASKKNRGAAAAADGALAPADDPNYLNLPSMIDILTGQAKRGKFTIKQLLYHFKLQLDNVVGLEKSEMDKLSKEHLHKSAAATMDPTSMRGLPDDEFKKAYTLVLQSPEPLPSAFWANVLHNTFERSLDEQPTVLSVLSLEQPTRTLHEARTQHPPQKLSEIPEYLLRTPQRVEVCAERRPGRSPYSGCRYPR